MRTQQIVMAASDARFFDMVCELLRIHAPQWCRQKNRTHQVKKYLKKGVPLYLADPPAYRV